MVRVVAVAFACLIAVSTASMDDLVKEQQKQQQQYTSNLPGVYSAIPDVTDQRVQAAASFAVQALETSLQNKHPDDPKQPHYSFVDQLVLRKSQGELRVVVARGARQVVAGMNYDLVVVLMNATPPSQPLVSNEHEPRTSINDEAILGSFQVTIYDHFGDLSVTKWGREYTKEEAMTMLGIAKEIGIDGVDSDWKG